MAIVKSALFDRIQGSVKDLTFRRRRNEKIELSQKGIPFDPESPAQLRSDAGYTRLAELYRTAAWPDWSKYDELAAINKISRWNAWIERHMPAMSREPLAYWGFAENEGVTLHDFTKNDNNGDIVGATWVPDGLYFTTNDYVDLNSFILGATNTFTVAMWFKNNDDTSWAFMGAQSNGASGLILDYNLHSANRLGLVKSSAAGNQLYVDWTVDNDWHHIVFRSSSAGQYIFLDGSELGNDTEDRAIDIVPPPPNMLIGARSLSGNPSNFFNGTINEVAILNRALSATEIKKLYDSTKARFQ